MSLGQKKINLIKESLEGDQFKVIEESLKQIKIGNSNQNAFGYFYNEIIPTVYVGLKELSKEVEYYQQNEDVNQEIKSRFNPLIYLAQFIMRNNPKHFKNPEIEEVQKVIKQQRIIRNFKEYNYDKLLSDIQKLLNSNEEKFYYKELVQIAKYFDQQLAQKDQLLLFIQNNKDVIKIKASGNKLHLLKIFDIISEYGYQTDSFDINSLKRMDINFTL